MQPTTPSGSQPDPSDSWTVGSGVGYHTGIPFVEVVTPDGKAYQMRAADAAGLALNMLKASESAFIDRAFLAAAQDDLKLSQEEAAGLLNLIRLKRVEYE